MKWALSVKTKLGNVYHLTRDDGSVAARCDRRIKLEALQQYETPPADGYQCARCRALLRMGALTSATGSGVA